MQYQMDPNLWSSVFAVPGAIVDNHLKLCGAASLKVLLLLLRRGGQADPADIASFLNLPMADILDAMNYWIHLGVLRGTEEDSPKESRPTDLVCGEEEEHPSLVGEVLQATPAEEKPGTTRKRLTTRKIGDMGRKDENIAYLLQEAQSVLGAPLTPVASDTIAALYAYYGMEPSLVLMLLGYCVSIDKTSMRYIEKVAASWIEQGIDTLEKAEREIMRAQKSHQIEYRIRKLMGITDRSLIAREQEFIRTWTEEWACSYDLIMLAYERAIEQKGKLSFAYMNGILQNWREKKISTPAQAVEDMQSGKRGKQPATAGGSASYDLVELESLTYGDLTY